MWGGVQAWGQGAQVRWVDHRCGAGVLCGSGCPSAGASLGVMEGAQGSAGESGGVGPHVWEAED